MSRAGSPGDAPKSKYGSVALRGLSTGLDGVKAVAKAFGYSAEELGAISAEANMGLSYGNPTATASLGEGETDVEVARVLKPGGRLAVGDVALKDQLPAELAGNLMAYVGCIAEAIPIEQYVAGLKSAGLEAVQVIGSGSDLNAYAKVEYQSACCSPATDEGSLPVVSCGDDGLHERLKDPLNRYNVNDYAASVKVYAVKPGV